MPNWVMNELTCIFQTSEELDAFKIEANTEELFASFFPMPEVLEGTSSPHLAPGDFINAINKRNNTNYLTLEEVVLANDNWDSQDAKGIIKNIKAFEETGYHDWYSWNLNNWGVKWDAVRPTAKYDLLTITFSFDSPWGCPEQFVRELSKLYPNATFEMVSGSIENDTHYEFTCENGKFEETCSYDTFREAVEDGKWGGWDEWSELLEESEEV